MQVLNTDRGFKAVSRTLETKMVMYIINARLNLTLGTIGKATADKMTAAKHSYEHLHIFCLLNRFITPA